jgi:hypothetical protein
LRSVTIATALQRIAEAVADRGLIFDSLTRAGVSDSSYSCYFAKSAADWEEARLADQLNFLRSESRD